MDRGALRTCRQSPASSGALRCARPREVPPLAAAIPRNVTVRVESPAQNFLGLEESGQLWPVGAAIYALRRNGDRVITPYEFYLGESQYSLDHRRYDLLLNIRPAALPPPVEAHVISRAPWSNTGTFTASLEPPPGGTASTCPNAGGAFATTSVATRLNVAPGAVNGSIDATQITSGNSVWICGWAVNSRDHHAADVLVFADGRLVGAVHPTLARTDVAAHEPGAPAISGFSLWLPYFALGSHGRHARVTVFASEGGVSSQLTISCAPGTVHDVGC